MTTESYSLLRDAYAIIDGIPAERIDLENWLDKDNSPGHCNTIACAAGWLALHPGMQKLGLMSYYNGEPMFIESDLYKGVRASQGYAGLSKFFGLESEDQARDLFGTRAFESPYDPENRVGLTDKELWKARVRNFLKCHG